VLHPTYYDQGFFNVLTSLDRYVSSEHGTKIELVVGGGKRIPATVNRTANLNGTARILGSTQLRDWFQAHFQVKQAILVEFESNLLIRLSRIDSD